MFALDVDAYLAEFSSEEKSVGQITAEVSKHQKRAAAIEAEVPLQMSNPNPNPNPNPEPKPNP